MAKKGVLIAAAVVIILVGGMIGIIALTSGTQEVDDSVEKFDPNKEYTVTFGAFGDLEKAYGDVVNSPAFKAALPNINVEFTTADFNGHHTRLTTVIAAGERTNDIEALEVVFIAKFVEGNGLRNLNIPSFDPDAVVKDIAPFAVSNAQTSDGRLVAIPVDVAPAVLFYREELVRASGIDPEEFQNIRDWDHFVELGKKLTIDFDNDGKIDQYALPHAGDAAAVPLNGGKGGWFDNSNVPLQPKDKFISALTVVQNIREAGIDADLAAWSGPWIDSFSSGAVAATVIGAWFGGALKTWIAPQVTDWRVAYVPGRTPATFGGTYLAIPRTVPAQQAPAAWEVIKYLATSAESQLSVFNAIEAYPALTTVYGDPIMSEGVDYFGGQKARLIYADVAQNVPAYNLHPFDSLAESIWSGAVASVITGESDIDNAYMQAQDQILATIQ